MKNLVKLFVVSVFVLGFLFLITLKTNNVVNAESSMMSKKLYLQHCAYCHGANGNSDTAKGRAMEAPVIRGTGVARSIKVITNGKGDMPGFKKKLTAAQISSIANYVKGM